MTTAFIFYSDPGHGWLGVQWSDLRRVGLNPTDFSRYSYRQRNTFFLEEDCDAQKFLAAWERQVGPYDLKPNHDGGFIRNLARIY